MTEKPLNGDQLAILSLMAKEPGDGDLCAQWIAEGCGHAYDTPWASSRLPTLAKRGLITKLSPGWYRISDAGRALISNTEASTHSEEGAG